ncbi:hypothetical protein [uncultured Sphingomonas sp.]|uniref:hypothetical protein n=1 Tax=uncultured Sphingomonas sp. TaxID=158754 RepID=UPI0035CBDBB4
MIAVLFVFAVLGLMGLGMVALAVGGLVRLVRRRPLAVMVAGGGIGLALGAAGDGGAAAGGLTGAALAGVLVLLLRPARVPARMAVVQARASAPIAAAGKVEASTPLDLAWAQAAALAATGSRLKPRLAEAHARCAALLAEAQAAPADLHLHEWAAVIRGRIPELVEAAAAAMVEAPKPERAALAADLVISLEQIAAEAEERAGGTRRAARDRFATMRAYVTSRTARARDWT